MLHVVITLLKSETCKTKSREKNRIGSNFTKWTISRQVEIVTMTVFGIPIAKHQETEFLGQIMVIVMTTDRCMPIAHVFVRL